MQKIDELIKQFLEELGYEPILNMLSNVKSGKKLRVEQDLLMLNLVQKMLLCWAIFCIQKPFMN